MEKSKVLLLFVKYPKEGMVKKRLLKDLDEGFVVSLYKNFVLDFISTVEKTGVDFKICFYPSDYEEGFTSWLGNSYCYVPQTGSDLGERMKNCFDRIFNEDYDEIVIVGSDIPDLPVDIVAKSFDALRSNDVVIGPSSDGGYYLIGFDREGFKPAVFENIKWGSDLVFEDTINILNRLKSSVYVLPEWHDVDTVDDLYKLYHRNHDTSFSYSKTMVFLEKYKDMFK